MGEPVNVRAEVMDPLLNFKFIVSWDNTPVAGVSKVGGLTRSTEVVSHREGGAPQSPRQIPGQTTFGPVTLERGIILDQLFEQWANKVWFYENTGKLGEEVSLQDFRKDIDIELCNQAGQVVRKYKVFNCWPSEFHALPELDANGNGVAIESLTLQNEGWQRDDSLDSPSAPPDPPPAPDVNLAADSLPTILHPE